ncbi:HD domain-containing phosphohydrolase [Maridesulfovibrio sp.]|uniref:HD domain-containing phosphohydrolase n=1 Tax=Maridesulfovibrio sp. TaxID=2795000 RepID=UPI002A18C4A5|nr:HD domain-containing phosphohydrolase [Maridesulfovibrio sp.]
MLIKIFDIVKRLFNLRNIALLLLFLAVAGCLYYGVDKLWRDKEAEAAKRLSEYQAAVISDDVELLSSRLVEYVIRGRELARARIFRFAVKGLAGADKKHREEAREDFGNFVKVSGFDSAYLFNLDGSLYSTSGRQLEGGAGEYRRLVELVLKNRIPVFSPLRENSGILTSDLFLPVFPAEALSTEVEPTKVLVLTVPLSDILRSFLAAARELENGSRIHLIQQYGSAYQDVILGHSDNLELQDVSADLSGITKVEFGKRKNLQNSDMVYSSAEFIPAINWWVLMETDVAAANDDLNIFKTGTALIAALALGCVVFFVLTIKFIVSTRRYYLSSTKNEENLIQQRSENRLLKLVCNTMPTPVSVKNSGDGGFLFVNKSFAKMGGLESRAALGLTDKQVFGEINAETISHGDQMATMSNSAYSEEMVMPGRAGSSVLQVTSVPCTVEEDGDAVLTVYRDITSDKNASKRAVEVRQQVINALIRAVESVPFLDGHTSLMRKMALEIAETLLLSDTDCATVEAAAILSQVGKTFVPREIMEKQGKLTPEEIRETQRYIEHTCRILEGVEFDLPIPQTIWQMQENLDGSGYPNGLSGNEISMLARILGVTNTFSALVQKRSYRKAKTARQAVEILQSMADQKYDSSVIEALGAVIYTPAGKSILQESHIEF